jgi:hypothetical protein
MATPIKELLVRINADASGLEKGFNDAGKSSDKFIDGIQKKLGQVVTVMAAFKLAMDGIKFNAMTQQAEIAFTTMLGSASKAKTMIADMTEFAKTTPFDFPGVRDAGKQLLAFGIESEKIIPTLKMLGDVGAGVGAPISDMAYLLGTIKTSMRATTMDINQFTGRGIPMWEELAKVIYDTKEPTDEMTASMRKMVESGSIGFTEIEQAFKNMSGDGGAFANLMMQQSNSFEGALSNLMDTFNVFLGTTTGGAMDPLENSFRVLTEDLENLTDNFEVWGSVAGEAVEVLTDGLGLVLDVLDVLPGEFTATAAAAVALGLAFGPWGAALGAALSIILQIKNAMETANTNAIREYWKASAEMHKVAIGDLDTFADSAQRAVHSIRTGQTPIADWNKAVEKIKKEFGLTEEQIRLVVIGVGTLSESQKRAAEAALSNSIAMRKTEAQGALRLAKNNELEKKRIANIERLEAEQKALNASLKVQDQLLKAGVLSEGDYYKNRIKQAQERIDKIKAEGVASGALNTEQLKQIKSLSTDITAYQLKVDEWETSRPEEVKKRNDAEDLVQKQAFDARMIREQQKADKITEIEIKRLDDLIEAEEKAIEARKLMHENFYSAISTFSSGAFNIIGALNDSLGLNIGGVLKNLEGLSGGIMGIAKSGGADPTAWVQTTVAAIGLIGEAWDVLSGEAARKEEEARQAEIRNIEDTAKKRIAGKVEALERERDAEIKNAISKGANLRDIEIYYARVIARAKLDMNETIEREKLAQDARVREITANAEQKAQNEAIAKIKAQYGKAYDSYASQWVGGITGSQAYKSIINPIMDGYLKIAEAEIEALEMSFALFSDRAEQASEGLARAMLDGFKSGSTEEEMKAAVMDMLKNMAIETQFKKYANRFEELGGMISESFVKGGMDDYERNLFTIEYDKLFDELTAAVDFYTQYFPDEMGKALDEVSSELEAFNKSYIEKLETRGEAVERQYNEEIKRAEELGATEETLLKVRTYWAQQRAEAYEEELSQINSIFKATGESLSSKIAEGFKKGSSTADVRTGILEMLESMAIDAAILASGVSEKFTTIGKSIGEALADGVFSEMELSGIDQAIGQLYQQAQTMVNPIQNLFKENKYLGSGSGETSTVKEGITFNTTFNAPTPINSLEAAKLMKETAQKLALNWGITV